MIHKDMAQTISADQETHMTITAKYPGTCPCCARAIAAGDRVEWSKGQKARHVSCSAATPAQPGRARRGRLPMGSGRGQAVRMPGYSSYCTDNASCGCYDCAS